MKEDKPVQYQLNRKFTYQPCFQTNSGLIQRLFFIWSHQIIRRGNQKHLQMQDLSDLKPSQQAIPDYRGFSQVFYSLGNIKKGKLFKSFLKYIGFTFFMAGFLATVSNLLQFAGPLMINNILKFLNDPKAADNVGQGAIYVSILIGCYLLRTIIFGHSMHFVNLTTTKVLNSANSMVYHKILSLSSASRKYLNTGSIMTHINVDIMAFYYFIMMGTFIFSAPIMIVTAIVLLVINVGWIGLIAPGIFAVGMFLQNIITKKGFQLRKDQLFWTDKRTKCVNQYFSGIRIIKYYGWEQLVTEKINQIRKQQIKLNYQQLMFRTYIEVIMNMLPIFASITIFGIYTATQGQDALDSSKVYSVLSIFNLIAVPMRLLIMTVFQWMNAKASLQRVDHFFGYEQKNNDGINQNDQQLQVGEIQIKDSLFQWESLSVKQHFKEGQKLKQASGPKKQQKKPQQAPKKKKKKQKKNQIENDPTKPKKKKKKSKKPQSSSESMLTQSLLSDKSSSVGKSSQSSTFVDGMQVQKLHIPRGQFVSVIGRVGSGKTTLLYTILGQIDKIKGSVNRRGTIAYIPQVSWLKSATIKQNILFESQYDEQKYKNILKISELQADLQILPGGDSTEIGQKGVNLSGGQKQRISIARALYADADIYLIDDCLSALDPYVGKNIFYNCLKKYLHERQKTIVFVTNAIHFTQQTDRILVIDQGKIIQDQVPRNLKKKNSIAFQNLVLQQKKSLDAEQQKKVEQQRKKMMQKNQQQQDFTKVKLDDQEITQDSKKQNTKDKNAGNLVKVQERLKGSVPWSIYMKFFTGPGNLKAILMFIFITLAQLIRVFSDWWLGQWGSNSLDLPSLNYIYVYIGISLAVGIFIWLKGIFFAKFIVASSRVIQQRLIKQLLKTPLSWFDVTPTGRIITRATKDQDNLDSNLSFNVQFCTQNLLILLSSVIIISVATPAYLVVAGISGFVYYKLIGLYMNSSRQIKRLQDNSRAPLIGHISQTINGTYVIRAFNKTDKFIQAFYQKQKAYVVSVVNQNICSRWINIVTDLFSVTTIAATGYFGVISKLVDLGTSSSNLVGLALVWSLSINSIMSFTLRLLADTQSCMNSVVRLYDYIDNNPSQKDFQVPRPKDKQWPDQGKYNIQNISYKYRPQLPLVLKKLSFDIKSKQKIGVVGRTGSGKSTLTLGMLRILQIAQNQDESVGTINLDNENVSQIGLHHLRHNVTIIPQDPTLFTGTIKTNIDPFNKYTDQQIAQTLKKVNLWDQIRQDPQQPGLIKKKVYSKIDDSGSNFSLGQKQLICMARALIRHPRVLLMDEATASIDEKTDQLIQKMIRTQFKQTTVITIAHRLNTIMFYDKILVLQKGQIKQYNSPINLVKDQTSFLGKLIRKTGQKYMRKIISLAQKAQQQKMQ